MKIIGVVNESNIYRSTYIAEIDSTEIERICGSRARVAVGATIHIENAVKLGRDITGADEEIAFIGRQLGALHSLLTTLPSVREALVVKPASAEEGGAK